MKRLNQKGFTLVELLAVIVILALIMAIAIYSISGILQNSREGVFKDTGLSVIKGVKNQLLALNSQEEGTYYFTKAIIENDNDLPFGGKIKFVTAAPEGTTAVNTSTGTSILYSKTAVETTCTKDNYSYVTVKYNGGTYEYSICLVPETREGSTVSPSSGRILHGKESELMGSTATTIFNYS